MKDLKRQCYTEKNNLIDSDGNTYLTVDSLIEINNIMPDSNNITFKNVYVKPCRFDTMYMDEDLVEDKLYQIIDQFNERKFRAAKFHSVILNKIHPKYVL